MVMIIIIIITLKIRKEQKIFKWRQLELVQGKKYERGENWPLKIGTSCYGKWIWEKNLDFHLHFDTLGIAFLEGQE